MIIINQSKSELINFDNVLNISLDDGDVGVDIYAGMKAPDDNYRYLGNYKDKERANKVLLEIINAYEHAECMKSEKNLQYGRFMTYDFVYEMPKE